MQRRVIWDGVDDDARRMRAVVRRWRLLIDVVLAPNFDLLVAVDVVTAVAEGSYFKRLFLSLL